MWITISDLITQMVTGHKPIMGTPGYPTMPGAGQPFTMVAGHGTSIMVGYGYLAMNGDQHG